MRFPCPITILLLAAAACGGDNVTSPRFSDPDGRIAFLTGGGAGNLQIVMSRTNGSGLTRVLQDENHYGPITWSPSGDRIAFHSNRESSGGLDLFISDSDGGNVTRIVGGASSEQTPDWSPDGARLAFSSDRDGGMFGASRPLELTRVSQIGIPRASRSCSGLRTARAAQI